MVIQKNLELSIQNELLDALNEGKVEDKGGILDSDVDSADDNLDVVVKIDPKDDIVLGREDIDQLYFNLIVIVVDSKNV